MCNPDASDFQGTFLLVQIAHYIRASAFDLSTYTMVSIIASRKQLERTKITLPPKLRVTSRPVEEVFRVKTLPLWACVITRSPMHKFEALRKPEELPSAGEYIHRGEGGKEPPM